MTSRPHRHSQARATQLFEGPIVFGRTRKDLAELAALIWLLSDVLRLVRSRLDQPGRR